MEVVSTSNLASSETEKTTTASNFLTWLCHERPNRKLYIYANMKLFMKVEMFFSVMTKNLNWEVSTNNLVTFKKWDGVNDKKNYGSSLKNPIFLEERGGRGAWKFFWGGAVNRLNRGGLNNLQI